MTVSVMIPRMERQDKRLVDQLRPISFETGIPGEPNLVDLLNGSVYKLPDNMVIYKDGVTVLKNIPINDYPLLLTFGEFAD